LVKIKAATEKNRHYLIGLYENLKLDVISETEYRELKSTYELRMATLAEQETSLQEKIKTSIRKEKALEQAKNSTMLVKTVSDLTTGAITQLVEKITVYNKTNIAVELRRFETSKTETREGA